MTEIEYAYIAGIIDADGHVGIYSRAHAKEGKFQSMAQYTLTVRVAMTHEGVVRWLCGKVGFGDVNVRHRAAPFKTVYDWRITCRAAVNLLEKIRPYMIVKRRHAEIAAIFYTTVGVKSMMANQRKYLSQEAADVRIKCVNEIRQLNSRKRPYAIPIPLHNVPNDFRVPYHQC